MNMILSVDKLTVKQWVFSQKIPITASLKRGAAEG